jgi:quercetin dioxygenase-like cupin family protein
MPYDPPESGLNLPSVSFTELEARLGAAPWRSSLVASPSVRMVALCMTAGTQTIPHFHPRAVEAFQVLRGVVGLTIGDEPEYLAQPGSLLLARRGVVHGIRVPGPESAVLLCTVTPNEDAPDEQVDVPGVAQGTDPGTRQGQR